MLGVVCQYAFEVANFFSLLGKRDGDVTEASDSSFLVHAAPYARADSLAGPAALLRNYDCCKCCSLKPLAPAVRPLSRAIETSDDGIQRRVRSNGSPSIGCAVPDAFGLGAQESKTAEIRAERSSAVDEQRLRGQDRRTVEGGRGRPGMSARGEHSAARRASLSRSTKRRSQEDEEDPARTGICDLLEPTRTRRSWPPGLGGTCAGV